MDDGSPGSMDLADVLSLLTRQRLLTKLKSTPDSITRIFLWRAANGKGNRGNHVHHARPYTVGFHGSWYLRCRWRKQKTAFSAGTVYFRHGAKSEPGTSEDLRASLERELDRIRSSWLDGITSSPHRLARQSAFQPRCDFLDLRKRPVCGW